MADDGKHSETMSFKVTERMALDLLRISASQERSISDYLYGLVRQRLYGEIVRLDVIAAQSTTLADVNR